MTTEYRINERLTATLHPQHLEVGNESHMHAGPATESHFKLVVVARGFEALSRVKRHQLVYSILQDEFQSSGHGSIHALALHLFTPEEWKQVTVPDSPLCAGKNNQ
jgi:stress-induced morphogen